MTAHGVFAVDRGIFDHPMFAPEAFTEREAWMWIFGMAAYKDCKVRVGSAYIELKRGQMAFSLRFLATKWRWSEPRVRRFLKRLQSDAMVLVEATRQATRITICNYDKYAFGRRTDVPQSDAPNVTKTTHARRKEEEDNNLINKNLDRSADAPPEKVVPIRRYAFEGRVIRLSLDDFEKWKQTYHAIPDIFSVLQSADDYYSETPPKGGKWFFPVSNWLKRENDLWGEKIRAARARPDRSF